MGDRTHSPLTVYLALCISQVWHPNCGHTPGSSPLPIRPETSAPRSTGSGGEALARASEAEERLLLRLLAAVLTPPEDQDTTRTGHSAAPILPRWGLSSTPPAPVDNAPTPPRWPPHSRAAFRHLSERWARPRVLIHPARAQRSRAHARSLTHPPLAPPLAPSSSGPAPRPFHLWPRPSPLTPFLWPHPSPLSSSGPAPRPLSPPAPPLAFPPLALPRPLSHPLSPPLLTSLPGSTNLQAAGTLGNRPGRWRCSRVVVRRRPRAAARGCWWWAAASRGWGRRRGSAATRPSHTFGFWRPRPAPVAASARSTASVTTSPGTPSRSPAGASGALLSPGSAYVQG